MPVEILTLSGIESMSVSMRTCILEANLQCCESCPRKVKRKLQEIKGVSAVNIDTESGLVSVHGTVQPSKVIQTMEKIGVKAKIYANNTVPKKQQEKCQTCSCNTDKKKDCNKGKEACSFPCLDVSDSDDDSCQEANVDPHPPWFHGFDWPQTGFLRPPTPPLFSPAYGLEHSPVMWPWPLPRYRYGHNLGIRSPPPPPYRMVRPPIPYPYSFNEKRGPPVGNSVLHMFSDDNVNACNIM